MDFLEVIYENFEKKHFAINISVSMSLRNMLMLLFLCICIKHSQHLELRKNNRELSFAKNCQASLFSRGQLKISKFSISLA